MRRLGAGGSAVAVLLAVIAVPAAAQPSDSGHPCREAVQRCDGSIAVPLDWRNPSARTIDVAFAWVPRRDLSRPATGTVVANPGGPAPALGAVDAVVAALGPVLDRQNLLVVEPRGFGRSSPLSCPGLDLTDRASIRACAQLLGGRALYFTTAQAAGDVDAVRRALGVERISFYGNSYGTLLGQAYATRHPRRLHAMFLDSVVGTNRLGYSSLAELDDIDDALDNLEVACVPSPTCRRLPGDGRDRWTLLVWRLRERPDPRAPPGVVHQLANYLGFTPRGREANAAAWDYLRGDPAPLHRLVFELTGPQPAAAQPAAAQPPAAQQEDQAGYLAYICGDSWLPYDRAADPATRRAQFARYLERERPYHPYTREEITFGLPDRPELCLDWPMRNDTNPVPRLAHYPDVPVYLVAGTFDVTTTPADARSVAARFPDSRTMTVRFGDHATALFNPSTTGDCARAELRRFLSHPGGGPGRCSAESHRALGSFPLTAAQLPAPTGSNLTTADRRLVAVGFTTAVDALVRRHPYARLPAPRLPGLRGGEVVFDDTAQAIELRAVRYVSDQAVSGIIRYNARTGESSADLVLPDGRRLTLSWTAFRAEHTTRVTGSLDGRPFTVHIGHT